MIVLRGNKDIMLYKFTAEDVIYWLLFLSNNREKGIMQKKWNSCYKKSLLLLVSCCLSNSLCSSSADQTIHNHEQQKTEQLKKIIHNQYPKNHGQTCYCVTKKILHIPIRYNQKILQLIEQGADPNAQDTKPRGESRAYRGTALHILCDKSDYIKNFSEVSAKLRFFKARTDIADYKGYTPRDRLRFANQKAALESAKLAEFDATIAATDFVRKLKKKETDSARSPLLLTLLPVTDVVALVHEFSDDAEWDKDCWPAIQEDVKKATSKPALTHDVC